MMKPPRIIQNNKDNDKTIALLGVHLKLCFICYTSKLLKDYLRYKTITSQNVSSEAQVQNFFIS